MVLWCIGSTFGFETNLQKSWVRFPVEPVIMYYTYPLSQQRNFLFCLSFLLFLSGKTQVVHLQNLILPTADFSFVTGVFLPYQVYCKGFQLFHIRLIAKDVCLLLRGLGI